jgi:diguanylate cyclase (GGDEF)-like protein
MPNPRGTRRRDHLQPLARSALLIGGGSDGPAARLESVFPVARTTVHRAVTSGEAFELAADVQPDLVILDAELADASGAEVCRALLAHHYLSVTTPVLLATSAPPTDAERLDAIRAGLRECVGPWTGDEQLRRLLASYEEAKLELDRGLAECLVDPRTGLYNRRGALRRLKELGALAVRGHDALACLVIELDSDPVGDGVATQAWGRRWSQAIQAGSRVSDVLGRVNANQLAVIAPATDGVGAVRVIRRLAEAMRSAAQAESPAPSLHIRAGYDAIANLAYSPVEPATLLQRAIAALQTGRPESSAPWIRRAT